MGLVNNMNQYLKKDNSFVCWIICILAAIQNGFFDTIFRTNILGGMDGVSLLLSLVLVYYFTVGILKKRILMTRRMCIAILLGIAWLVIGTLSASSFSEVFVSFRIYLYLFLGYFIFNKMYIDRNTFVNAVSISGLTGSFIYLGFYFANVSTSQAGYTFRDVSLNLYWAFLAVSFSLFEKEYISSLIKRGLSIGVCTFVIIISQQRSIIIPLVIIYIWYFISCLRFDIKKIVSLFFIIAILYFGYRYIITLDNFWTVLQRRFSAELFTGEQSTLSYRFTAMTDQFHDMNILSWIVGFGFGGSKELEMWIPNYLVRFGIVGTFVVFNIFYRGYFKLARVMLKKKDQYYSKMALILIIMTLGGVLTGYSFESGQLLIGIISGYLFCSITNNFHNINEV